MPRAAHTATAGRGRAARRIGKPFDAPGSLSADETYALAAFLLERNGVIGADVRLYAASLPAVRMPDRDGIESARPLSRSATGQFREPNRAFGRVCPW